MSKIASPVTVMSMESDAPAIVRLTTVGALPLLVDMAADATTLSADVGRAVAATVKFSFVHQLSSSVHSPSTAPLK